MANDRSSGGYAPGFFFSFCVINLFISSLGTPEKKIDVSSEGPSSGVSSGGQGKTTRVFIRGNTKTSRDKIKANQMDYFVT